MFIVGAFSLAYTTLRYIIFGTVPWQDLPFYVLNKAVALCTVILFTLSISISKLKHNNIKTNTWTFDKKILGKVSFFLVNVHILMSLVLFNPLTYESFFRENGLISVLGGTSILVGIISYIFLWNYYLIRFVDSPDNSMFLTRKKILNAIIILVICHLCLMGYSTWLSPELWPRGMPPISLISVVFCTIGFLLNYKRMSI